MISATRCSPTSTEIISSRFADGSEWTYAQTLEITRRTAAGFQALAHHTAEHEAALDGFLACIKG